MTDSFAWEGKIQWNSSYQMQNKILQLLLVAVKRGALTCNIFWTWRMTEIEGIKWGSCIVIKFTSPQGTSCQDGKRNICGIVPTEIMTLNQCYNENETTVFHFWSFIKWDSAIHFHYKKRILQKMISLPQRVLKSWARNRVIAKCLDVYSDKVNCGFAFVFCTLRHKQDSFGVHQYFHSMKMWNASLILLSLSIEIFFCTNYYCWHGKNITHCPLVLYTIITTASVIAACVTYPVWKLHNESCLKENVLKFLFHFFG